MYPGSYLHNETLIYSVYYAPRGRQRLYIVGSELANRYLYASDLLIGVIGTEGSGKSTLIQGLFPGLHLTNDDEGINHPRAPIYDFSSEDHFSGHTFHIDVRHELAFRQMHEITEAINNAVTHGRRVVVEHFDLAHKPLGFNAQILFGIGEEIIVSRPTIFGPYPDKIKKVVEKTIKFRRMSHSAEDITGHILEKDYNYKKPVLHSDIKHGFIINFPEKPDIGLHELEKKVLDVINEDMTIDITGEDMIRIGSDDIFCTGTRTHVKSSGEIQNFRLLKKFRYSPIYKEYLLVGMVGHKEIAGYEEIADVMGFIDEDDVP